MPAYTVELSLLYGDSPTVIEMELTAIEDFEKLGKDNELYRKLAEICKKHNNIWCEEAEKYSAYSLKGYFIYGVEYI